MSDLPVYITLDDLKNTLSVGGAYADDELDRAIRAASRAIDTMCGRRFYRLDTEDTARYYTPIRPVVVDVDDLLSLTSLDTDQDGDGVFETSWTLHADFELMPNNADTDGRPWERVKLKQRSRTMFPVGLGRSVRVVGRFGWAEVPDTIQQAAATLAARYAQRARMAPMGVVSLGTDSAARIAREDPDMCALIAEYDRRPVFVG